VGAALLLHLDDEDAAAAPQNEVELVTADACVRFEEPVPPTSVVPESVLLSAIHAAS
jgi:hypothetical protein